MQYNLTRYSQTISNTAEGDISLTTDEVIDIITSITANVPVPGSGTTSGTLVLDSDLGSRVHIDEIQYYFDSAAPMSTAASGIKFYYKNESFDVYTSLNTYHNASYYYTVMSGTSAPRYIRVEHSVVSGTEGYVNGLQVLNDDTYVDFGDSGNKTSHNFNSTLADAMAQIDELSVFNSGPVTSNAKIIIEPQHTKADDILSISDSAEGPWYGVYREEDEISGAATWDTGTFDDTEEVTNVLKLSSGKTEGTYTTRIVNIDENQQLTFNSINYNYPTVSGKSIIATDDIDTLENIEVRSSTYKPMNRESYIWMSGTYSPATKYTNHSWMADSSLEEQSPDWGSWGRSGNFWEYWYDSKREDEYIIDKPYYTGSGNYSRIYFRIRRSNGALYSAIISDGDYTNDCWFSAQRIVFDAAGGFWIYYYLHRSSGGIDGGNFYLRYYDATMTLIYNKQATSAQGSFLFDFDSVYESNGDLWYTDRNLSSVFKIDRTGAILASFLATEDIRGVQALADGGCWFIQEQSLIRLDSDGEAVDEIELPSSTSSFVYDDLHGGFWLQDGWTVRNMAIDGTENFNVELPYLYFITVIDSGFMTKQHDGSTSVDPTAGYVSREHRRLIRTWDYPRTEGSLRGTFDVNRFGARSQTYDDLTDDHASNFPIVIDTNWNTYAEWTKVSLRDYNFTNDQYHQLRLTLRADDSADSPDVYGIYTQRAIEVPNIYPGNYGRFYLKSDVSNLNPQDVGNYTSNVRAYWFLNTE